MAESDIELLSMSADLTSTHIASIEAKIHDELQKSSATGFVSVLRLIRLHRAILAVGMFSLFESLLQDSMKWKKPFDQLETFLKSQNKDRLAEEFRNYRLAINVLKHGQGKSLDLLRERASDLDFSVKPEDDSFYSEGDVTEIRVLVDADDKFVKRCASLIEEANSVIRSTKESCV